MKTLSVVLFSLVLLVGCASSSQQTRERAPQGEQRDAAQIRLSLGLTYLKNGNFKQAKYNLDQAQKFAPSMAEVHFGLAYYFQQVGEHAQTERSYAKALDIAPNNPDILNSYGAYQCQRGDYDAAERYFKRALEQQEYISSAETFENMALCSQQADRLTQTEQYLQRALQHQPGRAKSLMLLTELYVGQERWLEAKQALVRHEETGKVSPTSLLMAYQIERGLGNELRAKSYGEMLASLYPEHPLTSQYRALDKVSRAKPVAVERDEPTITETTEPQSQYHVVQEGENLYRISVKYNIRMKSLMEWNDLADAGAIRQGMRLRVTPPAQ